MMEIRSHGEVVFSLSSLHWFTLAQRAALHYISDYPSPYITLYSVHIFTPRLPAPDSCSIVMLTLLHAGYMQNCKTGSTVRGCVLCV